MVDFAQSTNKLIIIIIIIIVVVVVVVVVFHQPHKYCADQENAGWASRHDLTTATLTVLTEQGFTSLALLRYLTLHDVTESFQKPGLLPLAQCMALKRALEQMSGEGGGAVFDVMSRFGKPSEVAFSQFDLHRDEVLLTTILLLLLNMQKTVLITCKKE